MPRNPKNQKALEDFLSSAPISIFRLSSEGEILWANKNAFEFLGCTAEECVQRNIREFCADPAAGEGMLQQLRRGETFVDYEARLRHTDGSLRSILINSSAFAQEDGTFGYFHCFAVDITEKRRQEERMLFLADMNQILLLTQRPRKRLRNFAKLIAGKMADWCAIDIVREGKVAREAVAHREEDKTFFAAEFGRRWPGNAERPADRVIRTGKSEFYPDAEILLRTGPQDPATLKLLAELRPSSFMFVPLTSRGKTLGVITFAYTEGKYYTAADLAFAEDLAQRAALVLENAQLMWKLRLSERAKDEFLAKLSHELRNPLASILSSTEVMHTSNLGDPTLGYPLEVIEHQVRHLSRLLDDLLELPLISRGKVPLRKESVNVNMSIMHAIETVRPAINERQHKLSVVLPPKPLWMVIDPLRLEQILVNLLSNASKYTEPGGNIWLSCVVFKDEVIIRVKDDGVGIPQSTLSKIFDPFLRITTSNHVPQPGMGLGLTLVKTFVELHGGRVIAISDGPGTGSEFVVHLPLSEQKSKETPAEISTPPVN